MAAKDDKTPFRTAFALLLQHYDVTTKGYDDGWSDERIAKEIDRSPKFVAGIREEHFGPVEDPRLGDLRQQITEARTQLAKDVADARALIEDLERQALGKIDQLGAALAKLTKARS